MADSKGYVDTHFHVWDLQKFVLPWPTSEMSIHRTILPGELWSALQPTPIRHAVFIQVFNNSQEETKWVNELSTHFPFIKGIVGAINLTDPKLDEWLSKLIKDVPLLKGARHVLDNEDHDWITRDDVSRGLDILASHNLTFDLCVRPHHLKYVPEVVAKHPNLRFVVDHMAKPLINTGKLDGWKDDISKIAEYKNVYCKLSGMVTENDKVHWCLDDFRPFIQHVLKVFSPDRCMFGSDWPVFMMLGAQYSDVYGIISDLTSELDQEDRDKIFRDNATQFYKLKID